MRPKLLDLFCGAGGCSVGYHRAGFDVIGVDIEPHDDYPYELIVHDAMDVLAKWLRFLKGFDVIHASPPCQAYSTTRTMHNARSDHPDLVQAVRLALQNWGGPYVIENVPGAPLLNPTLFCGAAYWLGADCADGVRRSLRRHRLFESNAPLMSPGCACGRTPVIGVYGNGGGGQMRRGYKGNVAESRQALGIDWMVTKDLCQAIPPAYCEHIGAQLLDALERAA